MGREREPVGCGHLGSIEGGRQSGLFSFQREMPEYVERKKGRRARRGGGGRGGGGEEEEGRDEP